MQDKTNEFLRAVSSVFDIKGTFVKGYAYGNGLINDTYVVEYDEGKIVKYIVQRINDKIFTDVPKLMNNILLVTKFLKKEIISDNGDPMRETLNLILVKDSGMPYSVYDNKYYRVYVFIDGATAYQVVDTAEHYYESAVAIARFQSRLASFDASLLYESIVDFHNTSARFSALKNAIELDKAGRLYSVKPEVEFALGLEPYTSIITDGIKNGDIPLRVSHNDTKLNNIMIDDKTGKGLCVIDLDTIMPGSFLYDFGDAIRSGCNQASESEKDLSKVNFNIDLFKAYAKGYMSVCGTTLTAKERSLLPISAMLMTYECGIRFLTDYLSGDTYFKITYPEQNLDRARGQFKLVKDILSCKKDLENFVEGL